MTTEEVLVELNASLRGAIDATHACYRMVLRPNVVRDACCGDIARWVALQDESIDPARIVRQARLAYIYVNDLIPA
ncbi:MAG: hypothetical protein WDA07_06150 [Leucobacter sp.]